MNRRTRGGRGAPAKEIIVSQEKQSQLDRSLVSGIAWTAVLRWPAHIISWIATAFAARILTPADYGIVAMAMIAIGLVRMVEDFGMDAVLVQDRTIVGERQARLAGLVIGVGVALCGLFVALALPVAAFFDEPPVAPVLMALSLLCIADAVQVVPRAGLQREMEFARLAWAQFIQIVATQSVLVVAVLLGWGVWALVVSTLCGALAVTALLLAWHPYSIRWPRELANLARPLLQGWRILVSRFAYYAYTTADQTVVGKLLGKEALGAYSFSTSLSTTISMEFSAVVTRVVPGVFSEVQDRPDALRRYFLILTELLAYLALPLFAGLALTADYVVRIVLGPQWDAVILPLQILCIYAAYFSCQVLFGPMLMWTGQFRANMWCSILTGVALPLAFIVGIRWGLEGVAWAWAIGFPLANIPGMVLACRTAQCSVWTWFSAVWPASAACAVMAFAVVAARSLLPGDMATPLAAAVSIAVGCIVYPVSLRLLFPARVREMVVFVQVLRGWREAKAADKLALSDA
jgi:O-antigen/teichoic acid export membrane protein